MKSKAFVSAVPSKLKRHSSSKDQGHTPNICKVRSSASTSKRREDDGNDNSGIAESRKRLETLVTLEVEKTTEQKNGQCQCIWCGGSKKRRCSWCKGKGYRNEMVEKSWEQLAEDIEKLQSGQTQSLEAPEKLPVTCSACKGTKELRCGYCRGSGIGSYGFAY